MEDYRGGVHTEAGPERSYTFAAGGGERKTEVFVVQRAKSSSGGVFVSRRGGKDYGVYRGPFLSTI